MFGSVTLIWLFAILSMVHGNIHDIYFLIQYWTEDTLHQLKIKRKNIKAIFSASGGRTEMIVHSALQSRGFLLVLYRERQILKLVKFWLGLLFTRANG